jgi:SAM-dependent methyltransferase
MPDLLRIKTGPMTGLAKIGFHLFDLAAYEFLYRLSPARRLKFFNGGYLPLADDLLSGADEAPHAMMYHLLVRSMVSDMNVAPTRLLDVGCGQGGGLGYVRRVFPQTALTGTDRNGSVVRLARRNLAGLSDVTLVKATGDRLDFPDDSFDFVLSVGAPTYFGLTRFVTEAARVCQPGGTVAFSGGYRQGDHALIEAELREAASAVGLDFVRYANITPNTFASLKADIPRRVELLKQVPWPFSVYGRKWSDLPGSAEYDEYETGKRADFACVMTRP